MPCLCQAQSLLPVQVIQGRSCVALHSWSHTFPICKVELTLVLFFWTIMAFKQDAAWKTQPGVWTQGSRQLLIAGVTLITSSKSSACRLLGTRYIFWVSFFSHYFRNWSLSAHPGQGPGLWLKVQSSFAWPGRPVAWELSDSRHVTLRASTGDSCAFVAHEKDQRFCSQTEL